MNQLREHDKQYDLEKIQKLKKQQIISYVPGKKTQVKKKPNKKTMKKATKKANRKTGGGENDEKTEDKSLEPKKEMVASKKISDFMLKNKSKITLNFLKTICSDSGMCISFGTEVNKINKFFDNFINFNYAVSPIKTIGKVSLNGFVKEIKYSRNGYDSYAVLKSAANVSADNLMYEYQVGIDFINTQNKIFSCFLETYGLFFYDDDKKWGDSKFKKNMDAEELLDGLTALHKVDYSVGCSQSKYLAVLIQHINGAKSLNDFMKETFLNPDKNEKSFVANYELFNLLYQVYMPLSTLAQAFTHHDLHTNNVLLYEPIKGSYITYHYHLKSRITIIVKSKYIVKIIDYGRNYFKNNLINSKDVYKEVCNTPECNPDCGKLKGFINLAPEKTPGSAHYNSVQQRNISADLRLLYLIDKEYLKRFRITILPQVTSFYSSVVFDGPYGTPEIIFPPTPLQRKICNVKNACQALQNIIYSSSFQTENDNYYDKLNKIGDFHIYEDGRPMTFTKS